MSDFQIKPLPPNIDLETKNILRMSTRANRFLAELKGISATIPRPGILINTLGLQEAKDSSAIENIITTNDELFKDEVYPDYVINASTKEVRNYVRALEHGYKKVKKTGILTANDLISIQEILEKNKAGFRKLPGTTLKSLSTGETIYTPPQDEKQISSLMKNLEDYINDDVMSDVDPLIKMAVIHFQFESIHPFYDGNGRTGRIINILYLVMKNLLDIPILYMSRYIVQNKEAYYRHLQKVRDDDDWESWIVFMLTAIAVTSQQTIAMVKEIQKSMQYYKHEIRNKYKFYSQDLINNLFFHPYTKIQFIEKDLKVSRVTAAKYLDELADGNLLVKQSLGRSNYYINPLLYDILTNVQKVVE
ncbi:MAG: Fic family protein [Leptospiraceae bacterium]|nr:Fic family protein [Leptospiraceae bacterium]